VRLFPDLKFASPVAIEESYFHDTESRVRTILPEWPLCGMGAQSRTTRYRKKRTLKTLFGDSPVMQTITMHSVWPVA
jgi:hypothetical protein